MNGVVDDFGRPLVRISLRNPGADGNPLAIKRSVTAARWTFVIGKDGKVVYKNTKVNPAEDAKRITEFITKAEGM
jgi:thioredoxin-dependent peroxiredoxin